MPCDILQYTRRGYFDIGAKDDDTRAERPMKLSTADKEARLLAKKRVNGHTLEGNRNDIFFKKSFFFKCVTSLKMFIIF